MKSEFFSQELLDSYISSLKRSSNMEEKVKKSQYIIDWLDWLREKSLISNNDYERSLADIKKQMKSSAYRPTNVKIPLNHIFSYKYYIVSILLLVGVVMYIYIIKSGSTVQERNTIYNARTLPYKGVLLDKAGSPITTKTDIVFRIYGSANATDALYVGACRGEQAIEPDHNGNFTVVLGADCGMPAIEESIFQKQKELYLGVQLGSFSELTPRQKITTSGYSSDAARLQGLPLGSEKGSIPFINEQGRVIFKHTDPYLQTINGTFTIESPNITIKTNDEEVGSILFQPSAGGNVIVGNGKFAVGSLTPVTALTVSAIEPFGGVATIKNLAREDGNELSVLSLHVGTQASGIDSMFQQFYADSTEQEAGTLVGAIRLNNEGVAYETAGADFAEYFFTEETNIPPGYIMSLSEEGVHKSREGEVIIGVTSDKAGFVGNKKNTNESSALIALVGQVDVFVTNVGGELKKGDAVSSSVIAGYGKKGHRGEEIVGYALDSMDHSFSVACPSHIYQTYGNGIQCAKISILLK